METIPNELIIDTMFMVPSSYCNMLITCRRYCDLLLPFRKRFADMNITQWRRENHIYYALGSENGLKHGQGDHREILYYGRIEDDKKLYEVEWLLGKKHGMERYWSFNNRIMSETEWRDGVKHGSDITYYCTGTVLTKSTWINGEMIEEIMYNMGGDVVSRYNKFE
jgi:antitoxin component YwqK of YwqJK toxin-antitoxin module